MPINDEIHTLKTPGKYSKIEVQFPNSDLLSYSAAQFHIHSPSEHELKGHAYDAELHIVHQLDAEYKDKEKTNTYVIFFFF